MKRWEAGKLPWDLGNIPQDLSGFLMRTHFAPARALIPGCGTGYEVRAFHQAGFDVTAIDFSGAGVAHARQVLGPLGDKVIHGNFFKTRFRPDEIRIDLRTRLSVFAATRAMEGLRRAHGRPAVARGAIGGALSLRRGAGAPAISTEPGACRGFIWQSFKLLRDVHVEAKSVPVYQGMEQW